jgi:hypothetical protein
VSRNFPPSEARVTLVFSAGVRNMLASRAVVVPA